MLKTSFIAGILAAFAIFFYLICLDLASLNPFGRFQYLYLGIYGFFFVGALKYFRDSINEGILRYRHGILLCFLMNAWAAITLGILMYFYMTTLDASPLALEMHQKDLTNHLVNNKTFLVESFGEEDYQKQLNSIQHITPSLMARDTSMRMLFFGFFMSFIFTAFFRRK
ncbi:MAG: hypothetical protein OHK0038_06300 [Flammeovirgaceae bacterium]